MTHVEAYDILDQACGQYPKFSEEMQSVILEGEYTIEQLKAVLQLMEYSA